jgi:hypothetical protein
VHRIAVALLLGALLSAFGLALATPAAACSCATVPTAEHFSRADIVFTGRLVSRTVEHPGGEISSSLDPALHVFTVDGVFKGTVGERQDVVSADFGASCGLELTGEGPFVVYATESDGGYTAGLCDGSGIATPELEAQLTALAGPAVVPGGDAGEDPGEPATGPAVERGPGPTTRGPDSPSGVSVPVIVSAGALALVVPFVARRHHRRAGSSGDAAPG